MMDQIPSFFFPLKGLTNCLIVFLNFTLPLLILKTASPKCAN